MAFHSFIPIESKTQINETDNIEFGIGANYEICKCNYMLFYSNCLECAPLVMWIFPPVFFYEPPNKISNTIVTTFKAITGTLRNCTAVNIPTT